MNIVHRLSFLFITGLLIISATSYGIWPFTSSIKTDKIVIEKQVGDEFEIELTENRSTGYMWHVAQKPDSEIIRTEKDEYDKPSMFRPGAAGERQWKFEAREPGTTAFVVEYRGPGRDHKIAKTGPDGGTPRREYKIIIKDKFQESATKRSPETIPAEYQAMETD